MINFSETTKKLIEKQSDNSNLNDKMIKKSNNKKRLQLEIDSDLLIEIKKYCAENNISIKDFITDLVTAHINK